MKVAIVGAGIIGRLLALRLLQVGHDITLYDQGERRSCSMTAAGMLAPVTELEKNPLLIYELGTMALQQHWPALLASLPEANYLRKNGSLVVAHPRDQADLQRFVQMIANKLSDKTVSQALNQQQILQLEPEITKFSTGYFFPEEAQIDTQALMQALEKSLMVLTWRHVVVQQVLPNQVVVDNVSEQFDLVIDCRGLGASSIFKDLRAVRGELIWLSAPDVNITRPVRLLHPRYSIYLVPRDNHQYLIGASELESHDLSPISVRTTLELLTAAYSIHPAFAEARVIDTATHCRPTLADHLPRIKYADGFIAINGLYRHGYLIAPTLVDEVMRWLAAGDSALQFPQLWEKSDDYRLCG